MGAISVKKLGIYTSIFFFVTCSAALSFFHFNSNRPEHQPLKLIESLNVFIRDQKQVWTVVKSQRGNSLQIDFIKPLPNGFESQEEIVIPKAINAHFSYAQIVSALKAMDIDSDGQMEILVPYFDLNFIARMGVLKWNPLTEKFERTSYSFTSLN